MKALTEAAEALQELAKLPETTQAAIQKQHGRLNTQDAQIQDLQNRLSAIATSEEVSEKVQEIMKPALAGFMGELKQLVQPAGDAYTFILTDDNPDQAWNEIIAEGQKIQQLFWEEGEERWKALKNQRGSIRAGQ